MFRNMSVRVRSWPAERSPVLLLGMSADLQTALIGDTDNSLLTVPVSELLVVRVYFNANELVWAGTPGDFVKLPEAPHQH